MHTYCIYASENYPYLSKELERQLGITYKTAWRILHLIRKSLKQNTSPLNGQVEVDEMFIGGKGDGGTYNENQSKVIKAKSKVVGAVERGGEIRAKKVDNLSASTLGTFLEDNVLKENTLLMTDSNNSYDKVASDYNRHTVNHSKREYSRNGIHINHIESFWGHVKRSTKGTYKTVSKKHLQSYLDAFVWHYNMRHSDRERFSSLLKAIV